MIDPVKRYEELYNNRLGVVGSIRQLAAEIRQDENEACAKMIADQASKKFDAGWTDGSLLLQECAAAIRARLKESA